MRSPVFIPMRTPAWMRRTGRCSRRRWKSWREIWTNEALFAPWDQLQLPRPAAPSSPIRASRRTPAWQEGERVTKLRVTPRPYQRPHPPLWMTVSTDRSVTTAAELGLKGVLLAAPSAQDQGTDGKFTRGSGASGRADNSRWERTRRSCAPRMWPRRWRRRGGMRRKGSCPAFIFNDPFRGREVFTNPGETLDPAVKLDWDFLEPRHAAGGFSRERG